MQVCESRAPGKWFEAPKSGAPASFRLFCFPFAGGNSGTFHEWRALIPQHIDLRLIRMSGRTARMSELAHRSMTDLMSDLFPAILPELNLPFAFFGHSLGALVSFELARTLRRRGAPMPSHLFVSACPAPSAPRRGRPYTELSEEELVVELQMLNGTPHELLGNREVLRLVLPSLRADLAVLDSYRYAQEAPLACSITALGGLSDTSVPIQHLQPWRIETASEFQLKLMPGGHFFVNEDRPLVIEQINAALSWIASQPAI